METKRFPSEELDRFIVRMPEGMRARIAAAAKDSGRSMNAEIVHRLEASFDRPTTSAELAEAGRLMERKLDELMAAFRSLAENSEDPVSVAARRAVREALDQGDRGGEDGN